MIIDEWCLWIVVHFPTSSHGNIEVQEFATIQFTCCFNFCQECSMRQWVLRGVILSMAKTMLWYPSLSLHQSSGSPTEFKWLAPTPTSITSTTASPDSCRKTSMRSENNCLLTAVGIGGSLPTQTRKFKHELHSKTIRQCHWRVQLSWTLSTTYAYAGYSSASAPGAVVTSHLLPSEP